MMYDNEHLLMLSGIQHYAFCPRQWALIHLDQVWHDNHLTIEGEWLHRHVDNPFEMGRSKDTVHLNAVAIVSYRLGLYGIADLLELYKADGEPNTIKVPKYPGDWKVCPIEYKRGRPKDTRIDEAQLCAQAICLEEMYDINIESGDIYYEQIKRRVTVSFDKILRSTVQDYCQAMHQLFEQGKEPEGIYSTKCKSCSLNNTCMVDSLRHAPMVRNYLDILKQ
ncbi:MAG: CRISPR-associated protein Cas4 [Prevotella sp.]|jgi:CRISPR-associated exonuclease Cas4